MAYPAEPVAPGADMILQHVGDRSARPEVDMADDPGADPGRTVEPAPRHRRDAVGELRLPDDTERRRPFRAVHRLGLHVDRSLDRVSAFADVREVLLEQVAPAGAVPQVMVGVDDQQFGTQGFLAPRCQPVRPDGQVVGAAHGVGSSAAEPGKSRGSGPV